MPWTCVTCDDGKRIVCGPDPQCGPTMSKNDPEDPWEKIGCYEVTVCIAIFRNSETGEIQLEKKKCKKCRKGLPHD